MTAILEAALTGWDWLIDNIIYVNLLLSVVIVFFQRRDPKAVWTWLLALYFIPGFGILLYLLFGQDFHKSKMFRIKNLEDKMRYSVESQEEMLRSFNHKQQNKLFSQSLQDFFHNTRADKQLSALLPFSIKILQAIGR